MIVHNTHRVVLAGVVAALLCGLAPPVVLNGHAPFAVYTASGPTPDAIRPVVDAFRAALGPDNGDLPGQQPVGRRSITWDDDLGFGFGLAFFPDPMTTFNSPPALRGAEFTNDPPFGGGFVISKLGGDFWDEGHFRQFSGARLFGPAPLQPPITNVHFFVAGTATPATVSAFGVVFSDVDLPKSTTVEFFDANDASLGLVNAPPANQRLSFVGLTFANQRIARVRIVTGNTPLGFGNQDGPSPWAPGVFNDIVVMDDMIYAEPSVTGPPMDQNACEHEGWKRFDFPRAFANQGDCIQFVNTGR